MQQALGPVKGEIRSQDAQTVFELAQQIFALAKQQKPFAPSISVVNVWHRLLSEREMEICIQLSNGTTLGGTIQFRHPIELIDPTVN